MIILAFAAGFVLGVVVCFALLAWAFGDAFDMRGRGPKR